MSPSMFCFLGNVRKCHMLDAVAHVDAAGCWPDGGSARVLIQSLPYSDQFLLHWSKGGVLNTMYALITAPGQSGLM